MHPKFTFIEFTMNQIIIDFEIEWGSLAYELQLRHSSSRDKVLYGDELSKVGKQTNGKAVITQSDVNSPWFFF